MDRFVGNFLPFTWVLLVNHNPPIPSSSSVGHSSFQVPRNFLAQQRREKLSTRIPSIRVELIDFLYLYVKSRLQVWPTWKRSKWKKNGFFVCDWCARKGYWKKRGGSSVPILRRTGAGLGLWCPFSLLFLSNFPQNQEEVLLHYLLQTLSSCPKLIFFPKEILQHMHLGDPYPETINIYICIT
jgi:hypothetical protein